MPQLTIYSDNKQVYQLFCTEQQDILQVGLAEGLNLAYGCNNGTCGTCLAKVCSGSTKKIRHHDYRLSQQEVDNSSILMCCYTATTDLVLQAQMQDERQKVDWQTITTMVKTIEIVSANVIILRLKMPRSKVLQYMAGQEAMLTFDGNQAKYPIASCPCTRNELEFHIRHSEHDLFAKALFSDAIKIKSKIGVAGPIGIFGLKENNVLPSIFIAWDVSFPPIRSIIEHHHSLEFDTTIKFYWAYPDTEPKPYLDQYAHTWSGLFDNYEYHAIPCHSNPNSPADYQKITGQISAKITLDLAQYMVYLSVPAAMMIDLSEQLLAKGCLVENLYAFPT